jgi:hypothetical protein
MKHSPHASCWTSALFTLLLFLQFPLHEARAAGSGGSSDKRLAHKGALQVADVIHTGGDIITVNEAAPAAEALAIGDGRILAVGSKAGVMKTKGGRTNVVDLAGKTLLPGFIDPHSHIAQYEQSWGTPNLNPPPVGDIQGIPDIVAKMKAYIVEHKIPPGGVVFGLGYDDSLLRERRHPTRDDLDQVSTTHPVLVIHTSGHFLAANRAALKLVKYDRDTPDPKGGTIQRDAKGEMQRPT